MVPSHYLHQYWTTINTILRCTQLWRTQSSFSRNAGAYIQIIEFSIYIFKVKVFFTQGPICFSFNSLWRSDTIWWWSSWSTWVQLMVAPGNPTLWSGVPVASIQKSFGSSGRDWKPGKKLPIPCKFFTCRFIRYSSTCYGMVRIDPLMANITNPDFFASPVVNAARFVVVLPCYLNRDLLSGPKGN